MMLSLMRAASPNIAASPDDMLALQPSARSLHRLVCSERTTSRTNSFLIRARRLFPGGLAKRVPPIRTEIPISRLGP
jgi:hypothetical protein